MIYQNTVKNIGPMVDAFGGEMLILFGDSAPDTLKDFCYTIDVLPTESAIAPGQTIRFDDTAYKIAYVGDMAERNLTALGHLTVNFSGEESACLPGAIVVEKQPAPKMAVGTVITIEA